MGADRLFYVVIFLLIWTLGGCSDKNEDEPLEIWDSHECELLQQISQSLDLGYEGTPDTWEGVTWFVPDGTAGVRHVGGLIIKKMEGKYILPDEAISGLLYLYRLEIYGLGITGFLSERIFERQNIDTLSIQSTNLWSLPDNIFNSRMRLVFIIGNGAFVNQDLPESITALKGMQYPSMFKIINNNITGNVPRLSGVNINLSKNELTSMDFSNAYEITQSTTISGRQEIYGPNVGYNCISGVVPENILADTLKTLHLYFMAKEQVRGGVLKNMPLLPELFKMSKEYYKNHPELANLTYLLDPMEHIP